MTFIGALAGFFVSPWLFGIELTLASSRRPRGALRLLSAFRPSLGGGSPLADARVTRTAARARVHCAASAIAGRGARDSVPTRLSRGGSARARPPRATERFSPPADAERR